jgi:methionyl-tRNA formyltransferase
MNILFFGSTENSVTIVTALSNYNISAIVTQPPRPVGRKQILTKTPTHLWSEEHNIPVHFFETDPTKKTAYKNESEVIQQLTTYNPQLVISASYGQLIPWEIIDSAEYKGINIHPSLLPRWRGADPTPWTILSGDSETGVTIVGLSKQFDEGKIFAQERIKVPQNIYHEDLRQLLFKRGADLLVKTLPSIIDRTNTGTNQDKALATYARRLTREDGYIPWKILQPALAGEQIAKEQLPIFFQQFEDSQKNLINRAIYALTPWPGVWTKVRINNQEKRMKLLNLDLVQIEGKTPQPFREIQGHLD